MDRNPGTNTILSITAVALRKESVDRNIQQVDDAFGAGDVALRKESVDRNWYSSKIIILVLVALRKESVDRNPTYRLPRSATAVALRKESVDRNQYLSGVVDFAPVALRKESVDRNLLLSLLPVLVWWSLSARRAWIEIDLLTDDVSTGGKVALRKESVDRNP